MRLGTFGTGRFVLGVGLNIFVTGGRVGKRKPLSKKIRFEVFKRDSFSCQYCGESAPNVVLNVDHIHPVALGGTNEIINLVTSCNSCNSGKSATPLDDRSVVKKQISQLKDLSERTEQLKMMAEWRAGLLAIEDKQLELYESEVFRQINRMLSEIGKREAKATIKKYGIDNVLLALEKSVNSYLKNCDDEAVQKTLSYVPRICYWQKKEQDDPETSSIIHICATAQKNWWKCNRSEVFRLSKHYLDSGISKSLLLEVARNSSGIMRFKSALESYLDGGSNAS
jgi:hypothetical protein